MAIYLIASESVVFRSFVRDALAHLSLTTVPTASSRILKEKLEQTTVHAIVADGRQTEAYEEFRKTLRDVQRNFPHVRIVVIGPEMEGLHIDVIAAPPLEEMSPEQRKTVLQKLESWIAPEGTPAAQKKTPQNRTAETEPAKRDDFPMNVTWPVTDLSTFVPKAIVMGSSTGGPAALERFFSAFRAPLNVPIFLCQHMPPEFTKQLANRIGQITGLPTEEGRTGMPVVPGRILVAPGDYHMTIRSAPKPDGSGEELSVHLDQRPQINSVRPAVDPLFETAAAIYGRSLLAVVLTGMGEDGKNGALAVRAAKGAVVIQDAASCTVFGMPRAVYEAQACDAYGTPEELGMLCMRLVGPLASRSFELGHRSSLTPKGPTK
jgi:two-component system chemotaxis response regulator CheB